MHLGGVSLAADEVLVFIAGGVVSLIAQARERKCPGCALLT